MLTKKRKWDDPTQEVSHEKPEKIKNKGSHDLEFDAQNETPLPLEWQRCLDIKSGQIYFYNTRTQKRAFVDPRSSNPPHQMSLDLQLNLPCQSSTNNQVGKSYKIPDSNLTSPYSSNIQFMNLSTTSKNGNPITRSPSWLTFDHEGEEQEMVTAVCKKCYMLVMMCKSSPACPSCKFVHPSEPGSANPFNQRCSFIL